MPFFLRGWKKRGPCKRKYLNYSWAPSLPAKTRVSVPFYSASQSESCYANFSHQHHQTNPQLHSATTHNVYLEYSCFPQTPTGCRTMLRTFKKLSPNTRLAVGVGIIAWGAAGSYFTGHVEEAIGMAPTERDMEELREIAPRIVAVEKEKGTKR
ncbi:hypothetical protein B0I35DRAFT_10562 [Stachybotrys elegans]|uniref:Uncharacterized protein n=1 Tax=Stachybotrys elegans TaxID=80388 RepID=A0A8K0WXT3_9HYPO|nr:hypothetical protein B0I35DRAFT_10562 [Stachybotrys elegans]